jgi:hypothetical protein
VGWSAVVAYQRLRTIVEQFNLVINPSKDTPNKYMYIKE